MPSTTTSSFRHPNLTPQPPVSVSSRSAIADVATLIGTHKITIAPLAVLQPRARLISTYEPIHVGEGCIIGEKATVGVLSKPTATSPNDNGGVTLSKHVTINLGATVEARFVGEGSTIEAGATIGRDSVIGKYCKVVHLSVLPPGTVLPDYTVVYGNNQWRREKGTLEELRKKTQEKRGKVLRKLVPNANLARRQ